VIGYDSQAYVNTSMIINGILVAAYSYIMINNIQVPYIGLFSIGIEYVVTIAFTIALIINTSYFSRYDPVFGLSILIMILAFAGAFTGGLMFNLEVIPAIINTGFFIFILGWMSYLTYQISGILMLFVIGMSLYGFALLMEANPELFITALF